MAVSRVAMSLTTENMSLPTASDHRSTEHRSTGAGDSSSLTEQIKHGSNYRLPEIVRNFVEKFVEPDEYEDLPTTNSLVHVAAGCTAGIAEHCAMYPVDLVKTRMMALQTQYTGMGQSLRSIIATEGFASLWRGMPVVFCCAGPAHGAYFAAYEALKRQSGAKYGRNNPLVHMIAGAGASLVHDAVMTPVDAVKQRMQKYKSAYKSSLQCSKSMLRNEGIPSFYRSYGTQICMNVPQQCLHFMAYEWIKRRLNPEDHYRPWVHIVSGGVAGGLAAAVTTPLDVVKTLLNTQPTAPDGQHAIRGLRNGIRTIYQIEGGAGFFKGWGPRMVTIAPSTAICWCVYEMFKYRLS